MFYSLSSFHTYSFRLLFLTIIACSINKANIIYPQANVFLNSLDLTLKTLTNAVVLYSSSFNSSSSDYFLRQNLQNSKSIAAVERISILLSALNRQLSTSGNSVIKDSNLIFKEISEAVKGLNNELALVAKTLPALASEATFKDLIKALQYISTHFHYFDKRFSGEADSVWIENNKIMVGIRDGLSDVDKTIASAIENMVSLMSTQRSEYAAISNRFSLDLFRSQSDVSDKVVSAIVDSIGAYLARLDRRVSGEQDSVWRRSANEFKKEFGTFMGNLEEFLKTFSLTHLPAHLSAHANSVNDAFLDHSDKIASYLSLNSDSLTTTINESVYHDIREPVEELIRQLHIDFIMLERVIVNVTSLSMDVYRELHRDFLYHFDVAFADYVQKFVVDFNNSITTSGEVIMDYFLHGISPNASGHSSMGNSIVGGIADWIASALASLLEPFWKTLLLIVKEIVFLVFEAIIFLMSRLFEVFNALATVFEKEFETLFDVLYRFATLAFQTLLRIMLKIEEHILLSEYLFLFIVFTYYGLPWRTALISISFIILFLGILRTHMSLVLALLNPQFKNFSFTSSIAFDGNYHPFSTDSPMLTTVVNGTFSHCSSESCVIVPTLSLWNVTKNLFSVFFSNWNSTLGTLKYINE